MKAGGPAQFLIRGSDPTTTADRDPRHDSKTQTAGFRILHPTPPRLSTHHWSHYSGSSWRPRAFRIEGRKSLDRLPPLADGWLSSDPSGSCRREPETKSAPNKGRLGHLRCARQGLVRLSESNTKYGGNLGETGASAAPVMGSSIGESCGIPKLKKSCSKASSTFSPALHRQPPYSPSRACHGETHARLRKGPVWHARPRGGAQRVGVTRCCS